MVNEYSYDPWGRVLSATEGVDNPYGYAGYRYDEDTGLYQLWNRYYDPVTARFITKDLYPGELSAPGTMNGYAYCLGDPVNWVDPTGLKTDWAAISTWACVVGLVAFVVGSAAFIAATGGAATPAVIAAGAWLVGVGATGVSEYSNQKAYASRQVSPIAFKSAHGANLAAACMAVTPSPVGWGGAGAASGWSLGTSFSDTPLTAEQWEAQKQLLQSDDFYYLDDLRLAPPLE